MRLLFLAEQQQKHMENYSINRLFSSLPDNTHYHSSLEAGFLSHYLAQLCRLPPRKGWPKQLLLKRAVFTHRVNKSNMGHFLPGKPNFDLISQSLYAIIW